MEKLRAFFGYTIAVLTFPFIVVMLLGGATGLGDGIVEAIGLETTAKYTGGEVVRTVDHGAYQTQIHRMVFDALFWERSEGFIQVAWAPFGALPARIDEEIDADGDGQADFRVEVDVANKTSTLTPYASWVQDLEGTYRLKDTIAVRVFLKNPSR
jgi:hypothetical protein